MRAQVAVGIALILLGALVLGYKEITYTKKEQVLNLGPLQATAERTHHIPLPPILGWVLLAGGFTVLVLGARQKA